MYTGYDYIEIETSALLQFDSNCFSEARLNRGLPPLNPYITTGSVELSAVREEHNWTNRTRAGKPTYIPASAISDAERGKRPVVYCL